MLKKQIDAVVGLTDDRWHQSCLLSSLPDVIRTISVFITVAPIFYSYDSFPASFLSLGWFCPVELVKWPQWPKAHHSSVYISGFSSSLHPFMLFAAVFYKPLALWYLLQDVAASQPHLSFVFDVHKTEYAPDLSI